jgi:hypothetical protein
MSSDPRGKFVKRASVPGVQRERQAKQQADIRKNKKEEDLERRRKGALAAEVDAVGGPAAAAAAAAAAAPGQRAEVGAPGMGDVDEKKEEEDDDLIDPSSVASAASAASASAAAAAAAAPSRQPAAVGPDDESAGLVLVRAVPSAPAAEANTDTISGLKRRDYFAWLLFRALARGDFHHDFGENQPTRDKIDAGDENRFFEIAKLVSKKGAVWLRTKFKENIGKNLFTLIADNIDRILPQYTGSLPGIGADAEATKINNTGVKPGRFADEDTLLTMVGLDWKALKIEISGKTPGEAIDKPFATNAIQGGRTYKIRACPYRMGGKGTSGYSQNRAPVEALKLVTGGKKKFACIIDASGGFPFSELRNKDLLTEDARDCEVNIIESIENGADSATKILPPPIRGTKAFEPPTLRFLRDKENTVNYPLWENTNDPKSNIYSTIHIVLNRVSDKEVEANLIVRDATGNTIESFSIGDVSNTSNVKNATLYALAVLLEKGLVNEALVYVLIKRMGDWCQALSLLDVDRLYGIFNDKGDAVAVAAEAEARRAGGGQHGGGKEVTIRQLQADDYAIGIVTNDRILLAFCILLGLNVFYTSAMDIALLIYFENSMIAQTDEQATARLTSTLESIGDPSGKISQIEGHIQEIKSARDALIAGKLLATKSVPHYIYNLRNLLSNLARLRLDFDQLKTQVEQYMITAKDATKKPRERLTAANGVVSVLTKLDIDINYNKTVLASMIDPGRFPTPPGAEAYIGSYPDSLTDKIRLQALARVLSSGGRVTKSVEITEAKSILLETRGDLQQLNGKAVNLLSGITILRDVTSFGAAPDSKTENNYKEVLSVLPLLQLYIPRVGGGQTGGGVSEDINTVLYAITAGRSIRVLSTPEAVEATSTVNIYKIGDTYYDKKLKGYTVADEYIVTEDDLLLFSLAFRGLITTPPPIPADDASKLKLYYICNRYLLLLFDTMMNDLDTISQEQVESIEKIGPTESVDSGLFEVGTPTRTRMNQIIQTMRKMTEFVSKDKDTVIKETLGLYTNPPTGDLPQVFLSINLVKTGSVPLRTSLLANIAATQTSVTAERTETVKREQALVTPIQDVFIVDSLAQRLNVTLKLSPPELESLGNAIREALRVALPVNVVSTFMENTDPENPLEGILDIQRRILSIPGLPSFLQSAIQSWATKAGKSIPPGFIETIPTYVTGFKVDVETRIQSARPRAAVGNPEKDDEDDDNELGGGSRLESGGTVETNADTSSSGNRVSPGGRRGLYAGLRKQSGSGSASGVRE